MGIDSSFYPHCAAGRQLIGGQVGDVQTQTRIRRVRIGGGFPIVARPMHDRRREDFHPQQLAGVQGANAVIETPRCAR